MEIKKIKSLTDVESLITEAMIGKKSDLLSVLRLIKSKAVYEEKENGTALSESEFMGVFNSIIKEHRDSIDEYEKAKRPDLAEKEKQELDIIMSLSPIESFTDEDVTNYTNTVISEFVAKNGSVTMKDMKNIMGVVKEKYPVAEGKLISQIVKSKIG